MDARFRTTILKSAVAAPTADNSQPWKFDWLPDGLELRIDSARSGRTSDQHFLLSDLAAGACIENIQIQAKALGFATYINVLPDEVKAPRLIARMRWEPTPPLEAQCHNALFSRHTNREFPWREIPEDAYNRLADLGQNLDGAALFPVLYGRQRRRALKILRRAEALRFASPTLHGEMFGSVRFDLDWQDPGDRGLAPGALAIEKPLRPLFRLLRHWPVMRAFNYIGGAQVMALRSVVVPVRCSPELFVLTARNLERRNILQAGRLFQRFWLQAEVEGLAMQPFAAAGVLAHGRVALEPRFEQARARLEHDMNALTGADRPGLIFARLGRPRSAPALRSGRRAIADP